jgi:hypothetical protein
MTAFEHELKQLIARQKIADVLHLYCRGVDRLDRAILESVFWPDAQEYHAGLYEGGVAGLVDHLMRAMRGLKTQHSLSNILIAFDSDNRARSECHGYTYYQVNRPDGPRTDLIGGARYLDIFEKRGDEWRIVWRKVVVDYTQTFEFGDATSPLGTVSMDSRQGPDDPLYAHLAGTLA